MGKRNGRGVIDHVLRAAQRAKETVGEIDHVLRAARWAKEAVGACFITPWKRIDGQTGRDEARPYG
jgi:hypothetical protein